MNEVRIIQVSISAIAIIVALLHVFNPALAIDPITLSLMVIAFTPWIAPLVKSLKLPGGVEFEFQNLEKIGKRAEKTGLIKSGVKGFKMSSAPQYSFQIVAEEDPNLALAGLRIELEKVVTNIAESHDVPTERMSLSKLLSDLADRKIITQDERSVLSDLVSTLNRAVHGADVDEKATAWAMDMGLKILRSLEEKSR